jgi:hypothetical protein
MVIFSAVFIELDSLALLIVILPYCACNPSLSATAKFAAAPDRPQLAHRARPKLTALDTPALALQIQVKEIQLRAIYS